MGASERTTPAGIGEADELLALLRSAQPHGFFALVALIERLLPEAARIGGAGPPANEPALFRHDPALSFSAADVTAVVRSRAPVDPFEAAAAAPRFEVSTTFLGLTGSVSPLPLHIAEDILAEDPDQPLQRDFLDIFHHRLLSLLYRLVAKYDAPSEFLSNGSDDWSRRLVSLTGTDGFCDLASELPPWRRLRLAPLLAGRARGARTLELVLNDLFGEELGGAQVTVEEFIGNWFEIEDGERCRLGLSHHRLGQDLLLGERIYDRGGKFRVTFAPLSKRVYDRLLGAGDLFAQVKGVIGHVLTDPLAYELELVLGIGAVPPFVLAASGDARLGHNTWLGERGASETRAVIDVAP